MRIRDAGGTCIVLNMYIKFVIITVAALYYRSFFYETTSVKTFMACVNCVRYEWTPPIN